MAGRETSWLTRTDDVADSNGNILRISVPLVELVAILRGGENRTPRTTSILPLRGVGTSAEIMQMAIQDCKNLAALCRIVSPRDQSSTSLAKGTTVVSTSDAGRSLWCLPPTSLFSVDLWFRVSLSALLLVVVASGNWSKRVRLRQAMAWWLA